MTERDSFRTGPRRGASSAWYLLRVIDVSKHSNNTGRDVHDELPFHGGARHVRFIDEDVPLHVISRVFQGRHLLRPCDELNSLIAGVIGRAQVLFTSVQLFAVAFLSNHAHFMLQGPPDEVPAFLGFIKREISRRWGRHPNIDWSGAMWHRYKASALPTAKSQLRCFKYVLSQGAKEGLVARPQDWPGVHCAQTLLTGRPMSGAWLNATAYSRRLDSENRRQHPRPVKKRDYSVEHMVRFAPIPPWRHFSDEERRQRTQKLLHKIEHECAVARCGRPALGPSRVRRVPLTQRKAMPVQPWLQRKRRLLVCWASHRAPETHAYLARYWAFQTAFRAAADLAARAPPPQTPSFPSGAYVPGRINLLLPHQD